MIETKFMAWDKSDNKMKKVKSINYADDGFAETILVHLVDGNSYGYVHGEDCELVQFTGETDDKGNEIYRLDIVEVLTQIRGEIVKYISVVEYIEGAFVLSLGQEHDTYLGAMTNGENCCIEKIGNKFKDKHLLNN